MSKELNIIDTVTTQTVEIAIQPEIMKLDDLSLALVGGGEACVSF